jgi:hypothetical protein
MLANAVAETKTGQQLFGIQEMGTNGYVPNQDSIDFAYGTLASVGAAALVVKAENHAFVETLRQREPVAFSKPL